MSVRVFISADSSALSVGADLVADAIHDEARRRGLEVELVRTGSRGLFWLEPLVEVETASGRVGYGPVAAGETAQLFEAGFLQRWRSSQGAGPRRGHSLPRETAAPHIRSLRTDGSACRLTIIAAMADFGAWSARWRLGRRRRSRRFWPPACAGVAERAFRPASNGARPRASTPIKSTSSATPTRATAARSPTAC